MAPLKIEVSGTSTIFRPAERAVINISVRLEGDNQEKVSKEVISISTRIREILNSISPKDDKGQPLESAAVTHWSNSSLSTGSSFRYGTGSLKKKTRIHQASTSFEAKFRDFAKLGSIATTLSTMENVSITSIDWRVTDPTKQSITTLCRVQAVQEAMAKAKDYAGALDRPMPPVVLIRDTYVNSSHHHYADRVMARMQHTTSAPAQDDLNFTPYEVSIECAVQIVCEDPA